MSPEQIRGMPLDQRTDVFSAGIILHEMLTTEKLFRGDTEFALMEKVRKAEIPVPSKFNRRVGDDLDRIVLRCLARDVADRHQSAGELARELNSLIEGYKFDPKELREFMRGLFRKEYVKEQEENDQALSSAPLPDPGSNPVLPVPELPRPVATPGDGMRSAPREATPVQPIPQPPPVVAPPTLEAEPEKKGFWSRLGFKRKE
jgi:serine/threonine protein kinase